MKSKYLPLDKPYARAKYNYPDIYDGTPYNHFTTSLHTNYLNNVDIKGVSDTTKYFLQSYGLEYCTDYELMCNKLYDYYYNLNRVFNRYMYKGIRDSLITLLNRRIYFFNFSDRMTKITTAWDTIFLSAFLIFKDQYLKLFDETYGKSFKAYFDNVMSIILSNESYKFVARAYIVEMTFEQKRKEKVYLNHFLSEQDIYNFNLLYENPEYYHKATAELYCQDSSQLLLSKD